LGSVEQVPWNHRRGLSRRRAAGSKVVAHYNRGVSRFYSLSDADAMVPEMAPVVDRLRAQRDEIAGLRDRYRLREAAAPSAGDDPELGMLRLRIRGLVDQMQADVAWLDEREIVLRDIATGLLDFPALAGGRPVWLCWRLGEASVLFAHRQDEGFSGRRPVGEFLADLGGPTARD
jgi:hypothetical protein